MSKEKWLALIVVALIGIFVVLVVRTNTDTPGERLRDSIGDISDSAGDGVDELGEEIKDEIDDHTDDR